MKIIIGLGNPLPEYKATRHNAGQIVVSLFQEKNDFPEFKFKKSFNCLISEKKINDQKIVLVLPQTFMNESGQAVIKIIKNFKLPAHRSLGVGGKAPNLIVVHDDIDLPLGTIRIKKTGSAGGHKGIQSIINHLGEENFIRLKIGISPLSEKIRMGTFPPEARLAVTGGGLPESKGRRRAIRMQRFVLQKFNKEEKKALAKIIEKAAEIILKWLNQSEIKKETFSL